MLTNKRFGLLLIVFIIAMCIMLSASMLSLSTYADLQSVVPSTSTPSDNINTQDYVAEDGQLHTIHWAQGVDAPQMTSNPELLGTPGYFEKNVTNGVYVDYDYKMEDGKGYYDLNKNRTSNHCYLAAGLNVLHWWLEQNATYVDRYVELLKRGDVYSQPTGLRPIDKFDQTLWNNVLTKPQLGLYEIENRDRYMHSLFHDSLAKTIFGMYLDRIDGYWTDKVWDYFFNGYEALLEGADSTRNDPLDFHKDPRGGLFYPIFGTNQISDYVITGSYEYLKNTIGNAFDNGKGIAIAFKAASSSHAVTVWGAEYDEQGELVRLFITDSDDYDALNNDATPTVYGLRAYTVHQESGAMFLSNHIAPKPGGFMEGIFTLDLAQEQFEKRLNDIEDPHAPKITTEPLDSSYSLDAIIDPLKVEATLDDTGYLTYQWYEAEREGELGTLIKGAVRDTYTPKLSGVGTKYYYCEVTNNKNGKITVTKTRYAKVVLDDQLVDAKMPKVTFDVNIFNYNQFDAPTPIFVNAKSRDGGEISYKWYRRYGGQSASGGGTLLVGENDNFVVPSTTDIGAYYYYVEVTNTNNGVSGKKTATYTVPYAVRINVNAGTLLDAQVPVIGKQPLFSDIARLGNKLRVSARAADGGKISYQWYRAKDSVEVGEIVEGANSEILDLSHLEVMPYTTNVVGYYYYCKVTNYNENAPNIKSKTVDSERALININEQEPIAPDVSIKSSDNNLVELTVSNATMTPNFDKGITTYYASVNHTITSLNIVAVPAPKATFDIINNSLVQGAVTDVLIKVTAENGDIKTYTIKVTRAASHEYGEWQVIEDPTCTKAGLKRRQCLYCDSFEEQEIPMLEHSWTKKYDSNNHYEECSVCGEKRNITAHKLDWTVTKDATCQQTGIKVGVCECGYSKEEIIPKIEHTYTQVIVPPTCEEGGYTLHTCTMCNDSYKDNFTEKLGHDFGEWQVVKEPSYTEEGEKQRVCKVCGKVEYETIPKLEVVEPNVPDTKPDTGEDTKPNVPDTKPDTGEDTKPNVPDTKPDAGEDAKPNVPDTKPDAGEDTKPNVPDTKPDAGEDTKPNVPDTKPDASEDTKPNVPDTKPDTGEDTKPNVPDTKPDTGEDTKPNVPDTKPDTGEDIKPNVPDTKPDTGDSENVNPNTPDSGNGGEIKPSKPDNENNESSKPDSSETKPNNNDNIDNDNVGLIVGLVVGIPISVVLLTIVIAIVISKLKRR